MNFVISASTDVGIRKKTNQDSVLVQVADTAMGKIAFGVMCDGMGGFAKGELASATLIKGFREWFTYRMVDLIAEGFSEENLRRDWNGIITTQNELLHVYSRNHGIRLGTTVTAILIYNGKYHVMNIGDSRAYQIRENEINQITKDHTFIQREIDAGRMTEEEALHSDQRSVLLQCVGASDDIYPDYFTGVVEPNEVYMLCCDGFRHVILPEEFYQAFRPDLMTSPEIMKGRISDLIRLNIQRNEDDNISAILVKTH